MTNLQQERQQFLKDADKYERMSELSRLLHIPVIYSIWRLKVGKNGIYHTEREFYANSWVRNAYNVHTDQSTGGFMIGTTFGEGSLVRKQINTTLRLTNFSCNRNVETTGGYFGNAGATDKGIIVGSGTASETLTTFELDALIPEGTLDYQGCSLDSKGWNGGSLFHWSKWTRDFINNSGSTVTVKELGLANDMMSSQEYLFIRDLLASPQDVLDTETLTVLIELRQPFPS
jgi:hypothetical protein